MEILKFYIPVNTTSLPHYFGRGIILPSKYYENKPMDLQDQQRDYLILSEIKWIGSCDCSIEIVLNSSERNNSWRLNTGSPFFFYSNGIPLSRIIAVHFKNRDQADTTKWNINSATAFLPDHFIKIDSGAISLEVQNNLDFPNQVGLPIQDLIEKAKRYDILLGGLAFMKAAAEKPDIYPNRYFSVLSHFNSYIKAEFLKAVDQGKALYNDELTYIFTNKKSSWSDIQPLIFDDVNTTKVEAFAKRGKINLRKKFGLIELDSVRDNPTFYSLALLATYGLNKPKSLQDLISGIFEDSKLSNDRKEEIALVFGLNLRYSGLRNAYNSKELVVKFTLQSKLDYYTIESIYQYTFSSQKVSGKFDYIDSVFSELQVSEKSNSASEFWIIDTPILYKERTDTSIDLLENFRNSYSKVHKILDEAWVDGFQEFKNQMEELRNENIALSKRINTRDKELASASSGNIIKTEISDPVIESDGLELLDFKKLKMKAKSQKIPIESYSELKPNLKGFSELVALIRRKKPTS